MTAAVGAVGATRAGAPKASDAAPSGRPIPALPPGGDLMSLLAAAQLEVRDANASAQRAGAERAAGKREDAIEKARDAERQAEQAQRAAAEAAKKASWLKKAAMVAGVVAGVASVVATGGTSAPAILALAGAVLSASSSKIGEWAGAQWGAAADRAGLMLGVVGCAAGLGQLATAGAEQVAARSALEAAARASQAGLQGGAAYEQKVSADHAADAVDRRADALGQRTVAKGAQREEEQIIELLRVAEQAARKGMQAVLAMSQELEGAHRLEAAALGRGVRA